MDNLSGMGWLIGVPGWLSGIIIYAWIAVCVQTIARKTGTPNGWLAWIPFANVYLLCKIAGWSGWWVLAVFVPLLNVVMMIVWWWAVAEKRNKPGWLGILIIIPIVNYVILGILAFSE
ncbi:DUF5684 domain-containing protein [Chloroflexota bacterium]